MFNKTIYFTNRSIGKLELEAVNNWKKLNPDYKIELYDDEMCIDFLKEYFGQTHVDIFNFLEEGPIKCDFWRICILYMFGGIYSDIDNEPLQPLNSFLDKNADFVTCSCHCEVLQFGLDFYHFKYNPNFICAKKNCIILKKCIDWYITQYKRKVPYNYYKYSIMNCLCKNLKIQNYNKEPGIYSYKNLKIQIIKECEGKDHYDVHNLYNNLRVFNNRYKNWDSHNHEFKKDEKNDQNNKLNKIENTKIIKNSQLNKNDENKHLKHVENIKKNENQKRVQKKRIQFRGKTIIR